MQESSVDGAKFIGKEREERLVRARAASAAAMITGDRAAIINVNAEYSYSTPKKRRFINASN